MAQTFDFNKARDHGLLLLRVGMFLMIWTFHMLRKLANISVELHEFPDPLGVGHALSFALAVGSEGAGSIAVALGFATRLAALSIVFTMLMVLALAARGFADADVQPPSCTRFRTPRSCSQARGAGRWTIACLVSTASTGKPYALPSANETLRAGAMRPDATDCQ